MVIFFSEQDFLSGKNGPIAICCAVERLNATLFKGLTLRCLRVERFKG